MIRVKVNGTDEKVVLDASVGMTIDKHEVEDSFMDGGYAGCHWEASYIRFDCNQVLTVVLDEYKDAEIDCDEKTYEKWFNEVRKPHLIDLALAEHHEECAKVRKGKVVMVMRGKKVPIGVKGTVFWMGEVNYDPYHRWWGADTRVGIKDEEGNVYWTSAKNCDVCEPSLYYQDEEIIERMNYQLERGEVY